MGVDIMTWRCRIGAFSGCRAMRSGLDLFWFTVFVIILMLLIRSGIEQNPGPTIKLINNVAYEVKPILGDGACMYRSVSFALCGNENQYERIIQDCIFGFRQFLTELYYTRVTFAAQDELSDIDRYEAFMSECITRLRSGLPVMDKRFWGEAGHLEMLSLLYDIKIYIYVETPTYQNWRVFNDEARCGYLCLLNSHDHISVLHGSGDSIVPPLPVYADVAGYSRSASDLNWQRFKDKMRRSFVEPYPFVWPIAVASIQSANPNVSDATFPTSYWCEKCNRQFKSSDTLIKHNKNFHRNRAQNTIDVSQLPLEMKMCNICKTKFFSTAELLSRHMTQYHTVTDRCTCDICNEDFPTTGVLDMHKLRKHSRWSGIITDISSNTPNAQFLPENTICLPKLKRKTGRKQQPTGMQTPQLQAEPEQRKSARLMSVSIKLLAEKCNDNVPRKKWHNAHSKKKRFYDTPIKASRKARYRKLATMCSIKDKSTLRKDNMHKATQTCNRSVDANSQTHRKSALLPSGNYFEQKRQNLLDNWRKKFWPKLKQESNDKHIKLQHYVLQLKNTACDISTKLLSPEVEKLLINSIVMNEEQRKITCEQADLDRLTDLTSNAKTLPDSNLWTWNAKMGHTSKQGIANDERMKFWAEYDMDIALLQRCEKCKCSDILYGKHEHEIISCNKQQCHDCMKSCVREQKEDIENNTWMQKVKPNSTEFPKRVDDGHKHEYLPDISVAEKAAIALVHPVTTIKKYYLWYKRFRCESITLTQDPDPTWAALLPRTDLKGRFVIIERVVKNVDKRYICVDSENVRLWLMLMFDKECGHEGTLDRSAAGLLEMSEDAIEKLKTVTELADVDTEDYEETEQCSNHTEKNLDIDEEGSAHASMHPILSENHVFAFENKDRLYMNKKEALKIKDKGVMQFVTDSSKRSQVYNVSAKDAFPHLYTGKTVMGDWRTAPNECKQSFMAAKMLRKLMLYPLEYRTDNNRKIDKLRWFYAEDDVHMAHQYAAIDQRRINDKVGIFMQQRPETAGMDITQLLEALKHGADSNGIIDSHLPGLTQLLSTLHGSREFWYSERMGIETISRDLGDCNWFLTLNFDPRNDPHCRKLIWILEHATLTPSEVQAQYDENWQFDSTEHFSKMIDKHAVFISMLMHHKFETFMEAICDICQIPKHQKLDDWSKRPENGIENGWYFARVEFTETRGVAHYHVLLHLPNVLPTSLLGRIIQNGRVVRNELKYGNIKEECKEEAWHLIEMGLLAQQYAINFVESVSMTSFYTEQMPSYSHDAEKVIDLDALCAEYKDNYRKKNISKATNPLMRQPKDVECNRNRNIEIAKIAAVTQIHQCLPDRCGGNVPEKENDNQQTARRTCRFDFPKRLVKHSVVTMVQMNSEQMEAQVLLRRTHSRVNNVHPLIAYYWRANHDSTGLIDAAHSKRYCTKYASKSSKHSEMYVQLLEELSKRGLQNLTNNVRHVLVQVFLASCSHRTFMSKLEIAHRVMQLPMVIKSYANVEVVGCYWRATLLQSPSDKHLWVYSDRTILSAYAERYDKTTVYKNCTTKEKNALQKLNFKEFCETARCQYKRKENIENTQLHKKHQLKSCEKGTGHWIITKRRGRGHVRMSTVLNTDMACNYVPIDQDSETSYSNFMSMPVDKRRQLVRSYYELVVYEPWQGHPDETFLAEEVRLDLDQNDPEAGQRYSLQRNERYYEVYEQRWRDGLVAKPSSAWHTDNQQAYTLYLVHGHNSDLKLRRADNDGRFNALMEPADELIGVDVDMRPMCSEETDDSDYPSVENFLSYDAYKDIMEQEPPKYDEISVAYPSQPQYRNIENSLRAFKSKRFIADPPLPKKLMIELSELQQKFIEQAVCGDHQVLYLTGVAGSGKTEVLLHIMQQLKGRVQACATTGIAARNLNAPTLHGMLGLSKLDCDKSELRLDERSTKCTENRITYENIDVFVIDEVSMLPAHMLGLVDELMTLSFNPKRAKQDGELLPFGGKRVIFVGDPAQLPPVCGKPFYLPDTVTQSAQRYNALKLQREQRGLQLYSQYMKPNVTMLQRSHRNAGLLAEIANSLREGKQTRLQLEQLQLQYRRHSNALPDRGVHFTNETASAYNFRDLWRNSRITNSRVYVCRASYHETGNNQAECARLAAIPAQHYNFAPDLLCVYEGCEVRLVKNIDVSAGLVNGAIGKVIRVVYDAADAKFVTEGKYVPPVYLIVDFAEFRGFEGKADRYPFVHHPTWVPLLREKFTMTQLPRGFRKTQSLSLCWRMQFPVDLSQHITTHRSQGSTISNQNILVDLNLRSPSDKVPDNAGAMLYVSITRANALKHLLLAPIFESIWDGLCKEKSDCARRAEEIALKDCAMNFADRNGYRATVEEEFAYKIDASTEQEWLDLKNDMTLPQTAVAASSVLLNFDFEAQSDDFNFVFVQRPTSSVRHIGIDQGTKGNFAVVVVDKIDDNSPKIMAATLSDLELVRGKRKNFMAEDVIIALGNKTDLYSWMQLPGENQPPALVDKVFVHVEQMSIHNPYAKRFGIELATNLQQKSPNIQDVIVKLSQPNLHYASGPAFRLGNTIIAELQLQPVSYSNAKYTKNPAASKRRSNGTVVSENNDEASNSYRHRKQMSADIFKYIVTADDSKLKDMNLNIDEAVKRHYTDILRAKPDFKFDDLGDATLHALRELLCGSSNYKQTVPKVPALYDNRTVAIALFPDMVYWAVISCSWNSFICESVGCFKWRSLSEHDHYLGDDFPNRIAISISNSTECAELKIALTSMEGNNLFTATNHIKVIVKQQTAFDQRGINSKEEAGALTIATVKAMRSICDTVMSKDQSVLLFRHNKHNGVLYMRSNRDSGLKMQVSQTTGTHLNAILCFLGWFRENMPDYVEQRRLLLREDEKRKFFSALRNTAISGNNRLELLELSNHMRDFIASDNESLLVDEHIRNYADLLLIALSKNQQHVKAVAANYRNKNRASTMPCTNNSQANVPRAPACINNDSERPSKVVKLTRVQRKRPSVHADDNACSSSKRSKAN